MARRLKRALTLPSTISLAALIAIIVLGFFAFRTGAAAQPAMPTRGEFAAILYRAGLEPEAMAAVGITPAQTTAAIAAIRGELPQLAATLQSADQTFADAASERDRLERLVRSGKATPEERQALTAARSQFDSAVAARDAALQNILDVAQPEIGQQSAAVLLAIRASYSQGIPVVYRVTQRQQPQWLALRNALAAHRINTRLGEPVPSGATFTILAADAEPAVAAAKVNLQINGPAVASAWDTAVDGE